MNQRRTQAQRRADTQKKLLEATLDCIAEYGYQGTTTTRIVQLAGVSRGAQVHHYPTKLDLVAAAADYLYTRDFQDSRRMMEEFSDSGQPFVDLIDRLWEKNFRGRIWEVSLELVVASRTQPQLKERLIPIVKQFHQRIDAMTTEFFHGSGIPDERVVNLMNFTICLLRGLGFQTVLKEDDQYYHGLMALLKEMIGGQVPPGRRPAIDQELP